MIALIVARSKNNAIGKEGKIPWKIKGEQKQFQRLTRGNVVVMGRTSYEEIGHPLPNRLNVVVSTTENYTGENLITVKSLEEAIALCKGSDIFIAGGYRLYREAIPYVDTMYITEINTTIKDADVFFPQFDKNLFTIRFLENGGEDIEYTRFEYRRKKFNMSSY